MNPLKLALLTLGCACLLALAPVVVKNVVSPVASIDARTSALAEAKSPSPAAENSGLLLSPGKITAAPGAAQAKPALPSAASRIGTLPVPSMISPAQAPNLAPQSTPTPKPEIAYRADVERAQQMLEKLGFVVGKIDGKLGQRTELALEAFQKQNGLRAFGQVDAATLESLDKLVAAQSDKAPAGDGGSNGKAVASAAVDPQFVVLKNTPAAPARDPGPVPRIDRVSDVKRLQEALAEAELYEGEIDGKWGKKTVAAMTEFQEKHKLKASGKPDTATWSKLAAGSPAPVAQVQDETIVVAAPAAKGSKVGAIARAGRQEKSVSPEPIDIRIEGEPAKKDPPVAVASAKETDVRTALPESEGNAAVLEVSKPAPETAVAVAAPETMKHETGVSAAAGLAAPPGIADAAQPKVIASATKEVVIRMSNTDAGQPEAGALSTPSAVSDTVKVDAPEKAPEKVKIASAPAALPVVEKKAAIIPRTIPAETAAASTYAPGTPVLSLPDSKVTVAPGTMPADGKAPDPAPRIAIVSREPASAHAIVDKIERGLDSKSAESAEVKDRLRQAATDIDKAKQQGQRASAEEKVAEVETSYKALKSRFAAQVNKGSLAEEMAMVDKGFEAMKQDFKKGNYEPIIERSDGFKLTIELLAKKDAAKAYVDAGLKSKSTREKIKKADIKEIEALRGREKFVEAASLLKEKAGKAKSGKN